MSTHSSRLSELGFTGDEQKAASRFKIDGKQLNWMRFIGFAFVLAADLAGEGCNSHTNARTSDERILDTSVLRRGLGGEPASLDPAKAAAFGKTNAYDER